MAERGYTDEQFAEAGLWLARLSDATAAERRAFAAWLSASAGHRAAWAATRDLYGRLAVPAARSRGRQPRRRWTGPLMAAAAILVAAVLLWGPGWRIALESDVRTAVGQRGDYALPDGSRLEIGADSAVAFDFSAERRAIRLIRGEVYLTVTPTDRRPFIVTAGGGETRVTGTAFAVRTLKDGAVVTVAEGRVKVAAVSGTAEGVALSAGQSLRYAGGRVWPAMAIDVATDLAWRHGQLAFVQAPLAEVAATLERYLPGRIVILDRDIADRRLTAVFEQGRLDDAIERIADSLGLTVTRLPGRIVVLRAGR
jgi:transmembrane sensor